MKASSSRSKITRFTTWNVVIRMATPSCSSTGRRADRPTGDELNRLPDTLTRPPIATKRLAVDTRDRVVCQYKHPFRDGSTHVILKPLDFIARLAALVPRPKLNLTRFHGLFAPNFRYRKRIVPRRSRRYDADQPPAPMTWMQRLKRVFTMPRGSLA
jgi:hypothetical protein